MSSMSEEMESKYAELRQIIETHKDWPGALMPVLQAAQEIFGCVPEDVQKIIAEGLGVTLSEVYGVATFYAQFRLEPVGKYLIMLCQGTACHVNGSELISSAISDELGIEDGQTTPDGLFSLEHVACLGCCSLSPVMMINGRTYGRLTPDKARKVIRDLAAQSAKGEE